MAGFMYKLTVSVVGIVRAIREKRLHWELRYIHRKRVSSYGTEQVLTKEQEKQIREYYAPYKKVTTEFHNFYTKITGQFHVNYLPDDMYYSYIDTYYNDWRECSHIDNKCFYPRMFINIRQAENITCRIRGLWFTGDCRQISREELDAIMAKEPEVVVKMATDSEGGKGVFFVKGTEVNSVLPRIRDDIVIQRPLKQHEALAAINASSINTIRMISLISEEGVKIYSSILRMGISGARVDNASSGGITCGITEDGKLKKYAHKVNGQRFEKHSDSGLAFKGYEVHLQADGVEETREVLIGAACNGGLFGGGIQICPAAEVDDGLIDAIVVDCIGGKWKIVQAFFELMKGRVLEYPLTKHFRCEKLTFTPKMPCAVQLDGELYKNIPFEVQIKKGLKFYRP
jgi:hypothetical protein